jgi:glutathione peroxidase
MLRPGRSIGREGGFCGHNSLRGSRAAGEGATPAAVTNAPPKPRVVRACISLRVRMTTVYDFVARTIDGKNRKLSDYKGKVLLVVNVASKCGFTPQYKGLEAVYRRFKDRGFAVLGFPSNQFGEQEPGEESEIAEFCELNFGVTFPLFAKIDVNGANAHPLYRHLTSARPGLLGSEGIKWNFTKFLVDRNGDVVKRYAPTTEPEEIAKDIEKELGR